MSAASASRSTNDQANSGGIGLPLAGIALAVILIVAGEKFIVNKTVRI